MSLERRYSEGEVAAIFEAAAHDPLVGDLDDVLQAPGELVVQGSLRRWQSEELVVTLSPSDGGSRLRLATRSPHPWQLLLGGLFALTASAHQFSRWRVLWERRIEAIASTALDRAAQRSLKQSLTSDTENRDR